MKPTISTRVLYFRHGLIGLPLFTSAILEPAGDFQWMAGNNSDLSRFAVVDPRLFFPRYSVPNREGMELLVICNRHGDWITGNLMAPLVVDPSSGRAEQAIAGAWRTDQPLILARAMAA